MCVNASEGACVKGSKQWRRGFLFLPHHPFLQGCASETVWGVERRDEEKAPPPSLPPSLSRSHARTHALTHPRKQGPLKIVCGNSATQLRHDIKTWGQNHHEDRPDLLAQNLVEFVWPIPTRRLSPGAAPGFPESSPESTLRTQVVLPSQAST